jgi:signal transduction histidine kinase
MSAMSTQYELDSKEKTISLLERDKQIQESHLRQQRTERNAIGLIAVLLVAIIWLVIRFRHQRKAEALQEAFSQELIMNQENERRRISRELHDSVGQNILFIKNQLQRQPQDRPEQLMDSIDAALEEVRNISKALYPNQLEKYGLESAVDALCELTRESSGIFVSHDLSGIDEKLSRDARINFYRIIQECLSNTLKHAEATAVRISTTILPNKVELVVQDNGKGFDKSILERKSQRSFGMINLEERVKMLKGKFDLETAANKGTKMTFLFPV